MGVKGCSLRQLAPCGFNAEGYASVAGRAGEIRGVRRFLPNSALPGEGRDKRSWGPQGLVAAAFVASAFTGAEQGASGRVQSVASVAGGGVAKGLAAKVYLASRW